MISLDLGHSEVTYCDEANAYYIYIQPEEKESGVIQTVRLCDGCNLDVLEDGSPLGLEILLDSFADDALTTIKKALDKTLSMPPLPPLPPIPTVDGREVHKDANGVLRYANSVICDTPKVS